MSSSNRETVPYRSHADRSEEPRITNNYSITNNNYSISEGDAKYIALASGVVQSCERIILGVSSDVFLTLRSVVQTASIVAAIAIVGYYLVQIVPNLAFLLSRILVDLPLGIVSALCGLVAPLSPLLDLVFVQLPLAIGRGVLPGVQWMVTSLFSAVGWVLLAILYMITSLPSQGMSVISSVLAAVLGFQQQNIPQLLPVRPILM